MFSWLLAERAVRPGWAEGLVAAALFDLGAVVLGSFVVAGLASIEPGVALGQIITTTIALGLMGLVILGIPMLLLGVPLTVAWMALLRFLVHRSS